MGAEIVMSARGICKESPEPWARFFQNISFEYGDLVRRGSICIGSLSSKGVRKFKEVGDRESVDFSHDKQMKNMLSVSQQKAQQ